MPSGMVPHFPAAGEWTACEAQKLVKLDNTAIYCVMTQCTELQVLEQMLLEITLRPRPLWSCPAL